MSIVSLRSNCKFVLMCSYVCSYVICVGSMLAGYLPFVSCVLTKMDNLILRERTFRLDYKEFVFGCIWQACRFNLID